MGTVYLNLAGEIVPKARPRFSNGHSYLPARYRQWKERAIGELRAQWGGLPTLSQAAITIVIYNQSRGDLDNIAGAILDALVQAEIIQDDRLGIVSSLTIEAIKTDGKKETTIGVIESNRSEAVRQNGKLQNENGTQGSQTDRSVWSGNDPSLVSLINHCFSPNSV